MPATTPEEHDAGDGFRYQDRVSPSFPANASTVAAAQFGWIRACVSALVTDVASLPLIAVTGPEGNATRLDDHPALQLIANPASRTDGFTLSQQQIARWALTGNAFTRILTTFNEPAALMPLYPELVTLKPWPDGQVGGIGYQGARQEQLFDFDEVLHVRDWSWEGDARGLFGNSPIQSLHRALLSYQGFETLTLLATQLGQITGVFSAKAGEYQPGLGKKQLKRAREYYETQLSRGDGAIFLPADFAFHPTSVSTRDLEGKENQDRVIELICAVFGVPPVRIMLRGAKYSEAGHQMRLYWEGLRGRVKAFEGQYTRLARMFPNSAQVRIKFDFSRVSYLKASRGDALGRVVIWKNLGMDINAAAAYEGFTDAPPMTLPEVVAAPATPAKSTGTEDGDRDPEADDDTNPDRQAPRVVNGEPTRAAPPWLWLAGGTDVAPTDDGDPDV
jgi:HK97 family phage portal protein